jgi:hypothetical protein
MKIHVFWGVNTASLDVGYRRFQNSYCLQLQVGRIAQSVQRLATDWAVRESNPGGQ